jgi:hypothetical protein
MVKRDILFNGAWVGSYEATDNEQKDASFIHDLLVGKGLIKEVPQYNQIHGQANAFAEVANAIYAKDLKVSPYKGSSAPPFVVNATFSVELYLKAVLNIYGVKAWGHDLGKLYREVPEAGKVVFEQAATDVAPRYSLETGEAYIGILENLSKAFEQWRYIYENDGVRVEIQAIRYAMHTSHEACCRIRNTQEKT